MRSITNFQEAENAIKELQNQLDLFRSKDIDLSKRRVVNAAPSRDQYDYVVRKELEQFAGEGLPTFDPLRNYLIVFSSSTVLYSGTNVSAPFIVKTPGKPRAIIVTALTIPTLTGAVLQPNVNGTNLIASGGQTIEIPSTANSGEIFFTTDLIDIVFNEYDLVNLNVLSAGTGTAAAKVTVEIWMEVI